MPGDPLEPDAKTNTPTSRLEARIVRGMRYIECHLGREIALDDLAREVGLSPYHFHRLFRAVVGEPVIEFARRLRLEHGAYRLRSTRWTISRVALEVGYDSVDAFGRAFRERFGMTPSAFRRNHRRDEGAKDGVPTYPLVIGSGVTQVSTRFVRRGAADSSRLSGAPPRVVFRHSLRLLCLRHLGPYHEVWRTWRRLEEWAESRALLTMHEGRPVRFGMSHDDPTLVPSERLRYDAAVPLADASPVPDALSRAAPAAANRDDEQPVFLHDVPAGEFAVASHIGPYHLLGEAYTRLYDWLPWSGREPADRPPLEWYRNDARDVEADQLVTEILLPLR